MADYKDIVGTAVRNNAGVMTSAKTGELFYDSTNLNFIYRNPNVTSAGAWRTGGIMNTGRVELAGAGTQTAGLMFGGSPGTGKTESYNGATFSEVADLNTARNGLGGAGASNTSALAFGGGAPADTAVTANTEVWNGSGWTEVNNLNTARHFSGDAGNATAALVVSGDTGSLSVDVESWNGTSWTEIANVNVARELGASNGTTTSSLFYGGTPGSGSVANNESWNGTAWSEVADLNTARRQFGPGATGSSTSGLVFGGETPGAANVANVETFNGTSWSAFSDLSVARRGGIGAGANTASGLFSGGNPDTDATEEYTSPLVAVKTVDID